MLVHHSAEADAGNAQPGLDPSQVPRKNTAHHIPRIFADVPAPAPDP
jgi:hypothetical protein